MRKIEVSRSSPAYASYRAASVRSMFNVTEVEGAKFSASVGIPDDTDDWKIGCIVGASGTGKTSIGSQIWNTGIHNGFDWDSDKPIIDQIGDDFNNATAVLSSVGLGSVPSWLRPYHVLSNGEKFRADLARVLSVKPDRIVIDEFTSVLDRQVALIGSSAFSKAWKRTGGKCVILSCHYDILDYLQPDWVLDTATWELQRGCLWQRPNINLEIYSTDSKPWREVFEKHHYLKLPLPVAPNYYVGVADGNPVCHICATTGSGFKYARLTRLVVHPEWQGAGVGMVFLNTVASWWKRGYNRYHYPMNGIIHTSHPGLIAALSRSKYWKLHSSQMGGSDKKRSRATIAKSQKARANCGYGGHFRAVAGFKYMGGFDAEIPS
jgi:GNAT superfamily N-acetyltransferase